MKCNAFFLFALLILDLTCVIFASDEAWRTGNNQLTSVLNAAIDDMWSDGDIDAIYSEWFQYTNIFRPLCSADTNSDSWIPREDAIGTLKTVLDNETLTFAGYIGPPILFYDENNELTGDEYDMGVAIGAKISRHYNITMKIVWTFPDVPDDFFKGMSDPLIKGEYDAVMAYMSARDERREFVDFTCPYAPLSGNSMVRSTLNPEWNATTPAEFNDPKFKIGLLAGSEYEIFFNKSMPRAQMVPINSDPSQGYDLILNDTIHALIDDSLIIGYFLTTHPDAPCFTMPSYRFTSGDAAAIAIATRKDPSSKEGSPSKSPDHRVVAIVVPVVGAAVLALVGAVVFIMVKRRRTDKKDDLDLTDLPKVHSLENIKVMHVLGKGHFGEVRLGDWNGTQVALKTINNGAQDYETGRKELEAEVSILSTLKHPNIVQFLGSFQHQTEDALVEYMVFEYMSKGSLSKAMHSRAPFTLEESLRLIALICKAMVYLESKKVVHRDIALRNILVDDFYNPKISDFGLSRFYDGFYKMTSIATIPVRWASPEALMQGDITSKSDVFSFAVLIWEIFEGGKIPWGVELSSLDVGKKVIAGERLPCPEGCPDKLYQLMLRCWAKDPAERPSFADILEELSVVFSVEESHYTSFDKSVSGDFSDYNNIDFKKRAISRAPSEQIQEEKK
eukprot:TRINITY_DN4098_c0_g1_i1.p1 TRINITY_DN4098_c0_g1~~TRINITY_DN4098_c0_g1_i1.p1  ORF type:complete len:674 (-),score=153.00 TRINITY_DN4098_c0_g1_i1:2-2023(-)